MICCFFFFSVLLLLTNHRGKTILLGAISSAIKVLEKLEPWICGRYGKLLCIRSKPRAILKIVHTDGGFLSSHKIYIEKCLLRTNWNFLFVSHICKQLFRRLYPQIVVCIYVWIAQTFISVMKLWPKCLKIHLFTYHVHAPKVNSFEMKCHPIVHT